jgi:hypothetical protein
MMAQVAPCDMEHRYRINAAGRALWAKIVLSGATVLVASYQRLVRVS